MSGSESGYDEFMTQLDIILVFAVVSWIGVILLAWSHEDHQGNQETGTNIALLLVGATIVGFALVYFFK